MAQRLRVIGSYVSPYVRKALTCLELKGVLLSHRVVRALRDRCRAAPHW